MIASFCTIDLVILTVWYLRDPMIRRLETFPLEDPDITDEDIKVNQRDYNIV